MFSLLPKKRPLGFSIKTLTVPLATAWIQMIPGDNCLLSFEERHSPIRFRSLLADEVG
jgi:hypothetical protein